MSDDAQHGRAVKHTECAVCGYEPDPDRFPPHYVLSLHPDERGEETIKSYPFGGSLTVPFACSDECFLDAERDGFALYTGGEHVAD